jgi:hypothetical protein
MFACACECLRARVSVVCMGFNCSKVLVVNSSSKTGISCSKVSLVNSSSKVLCVRVRCGVHGCEFVCGKV